MNKTDRKNKTNLNVTWPTTGGYFTIAELGIANPDFIEITLRVRVDKAIKKDGTVSVIGYKNSGKGRPKMILAMNPVSQELLDKAYADGVQPVESKSLVNIMNVPAPVVVTTPVAPEDHTVKGVDVIINPVAVISTMLD